MSESYPLPDTEGATIGFTHHARGQWQRRALNRGLADVGIKSAWNAGVTIHCEWVDGFARLHPPSEIILVFKRYDPSLFDPDDPPSWVDPMNPPDFGVTTVLNAYEHDMERYCVACAACGEWTPLYEADRVRRAREAAAPVERPPAHCIPCRLPEGWSRA